MADDWTDWFWWLEKADQAITQQFTSRRAYALEITGASKRQERLELQRETNYEIGDEHEDAGCNGGIEHEHGRQTQTIPSGNEPCPHPGCMETPKANCGFCGGRGTDLDLHTPCDHCKGSGVIQTGPTPLHTHIGPPVSYTPQDDKVADLKDGWSIKRCKTFGDLKYEGLMMNHCIQEDADTQECDTCEGSGECNEDTDRYGDRAHGSGEQQCDGCDGNGDDECPECEGEGKQNCANCSESIHHTEKCYRCGGEGHIRDGAGNTESCPRCTGKGVLHTTHDESSGEVECDTCAGKGEDEEGEDCEDCSGLGKTQCPECEGESKVDCDECDGNGVRTCGDCSGDGTVSCETCRGDGTCRDCDGEGRSEGSGGGAPNYYQPFTQSEADKFGRAPGGPNSLRDADNIPHVSFLGHDKHINNVFGRGDKMPSPENQHRILQYLHGKIGDGPCSGCNGTGKTPKIMAHDEEYPCRICGGHGKATGTVQWATRGNQSYTQGEIEGILNGTLPHRPDTLLLAQSKDEPNSVHSFDDVRAARSFAGSHATVPTPDGRRNGTASETHNLYAIPSIAVGKDSMIYNPAGSKWELKSGRGSRLPLETAGAQIPWEAIHATKVPCGACDARGYHTSDTEGMSTCDNCGGDGRVLDHGNADTISNLPDFAKALLPKVAQSPSPRYICPRCQDSVSKPGETCASCQRLTSGFVDSDATLPERIDGAVGDPGYVWERSSSDIAHEVFGWKKSQSMGPKVDGYGVWSGFYCSEHDDNHPEMRIPLYTDEKHRWEQDPQSYCWHELIRSCSPEDSPEWLGIHKSRTADLIPFPPGKDGNVDEDTWLPPFSEGELHAQFTPSQRTRYRRDG